MGSHKFYSREQIRRALARTVRGFRRRRADEMSQEELANEAGLDRSYVGQIERGLRSATIEKICRLMVVLGCNCAEFGAEFDKNLRANNRSKH